LGWRQGRARAFAHCLERAQQGAEQINRACVQLEAKKWVFDASRVRPANFWSEDSDSTNEAEFAR
jgi:hypothetical protein